MCVPIPAEAIRGFQIPEAGVVSGCMQPDEGVGNPALVLCNNNKHS